MRIKICNVVLTPGVDHEEHIPFIPDAEIQIDGKEIVYAGPQAQAPAFAADEVIEGRGDLAMPGLVNLHTHTPMTLLRSVGGGLKLDDWLNKAIFPREKHLTDEAVRAGSDLGIMEMLRFGTTSFCDMYMHMDMEAQAVKDSGMRAMLGHGIVDFDGLCKDMDPGVALFNRWHGACDDRIRVSVAPHSEGATTETLMRKVVAFAKERKATIHVHVSETKQDFDGCMQRRGCTPPEYLDRLGALDVPVIAAHCVWFTDSDIDLFAKRGAVVVHNPISNLKLASGVAPIYRMLCAGCKVALGTDGVASNNSLNLWEEIKLTPMLQKGTVFDPTVVTPAQAFAAATTVGARAMGYDRLGLLKPGYLADLVLVDLHTPNAAPMNDMENDLIYAVQGSDVRMTMVDGRVLYKDGRFATLDPKAVVQRAEREAQEIERKTALGR